MDRGLHLVSHHSEIQTKWQPKPVRMYWDILANYRSEMNEVGVWQFLYIKQFSCSLGTDPRNNSNMQGLTWDLLT